MNGETVGFIGTGVMGASMAGHLLAAGHRLLVFNRTRARAEGLLSRGAEWRGSPAEIARDCGVIITMVGYPDDVEKTYFGPAGLLENARPGALLIDMTTSCPTLAKRIYEEAKKRGLRALDAPVSGGDTGARNAALSIMVGGDAEAFEAALPIFQKMGKNIVRQGPAGSGQHAKMSNQIAIAANMMGVCESLAYAQKAGLDPALVLKSIESGAAGSWSLSNLGPRMLAGNFEPGFYVRHFIKDMDIALKSAEKMGLETPALRLARQLYQRLAGEGGENSGTQALFRLYTEGR